MNFGWHGPGPRRRGDGAGQARHHGAGPPAPSPRACRQDHRHPRQSLGRARHRGRGRTTAAYQRGACFGDGFHVAWSAPDVMREQIREVWTECENVGRLGTDLTFSLRAGYSIREGAALHPKASLLGPPQFIVEQIQRYADVGVSQIVLEAPARDLDEHLTLMRRFTEDIRPLTEA